MKGTPTPSERISKLWGEKLRSRRAGQGFTQVTFAQKVHRDQTTISRFERGEAPWTHEVMLQFAVALETTAPELFPWPVGIEDAEAFRQHKAAKSKAVA